MDIMTMAILDEDGTARQMLQIPKEQFKIGQVISNHPRLDGEFIVRWFDSVVVGIEEIK